jgi:ELWxxDGT repeat protein
MALSKTYIILLALAVELPAQSLLLDIRPDTLPAFDHPAELTVSGSKLFFRGVDRSGTELWCSDGTPGNEALAREIGPGGVSALPESITDLDGNGRVVFTAYLPATGREPWVSDGTAGGTFALGDLSPGESTSAPSGILRVGSRVFFAADDGVRGRELWVTDGSPAGTVIVVDLAPGAAPGWRGSDAAPGIPLGNLLLFAASDGIRGDELWASNGSAAFPIADLDPLGQATIERFDASADPTRVWITVRDAAGGVSIVTTDGTRAGTRSVVDVTALTNGTVDTAHDAGGDLYFTSGGQLFRTVSTSGTTTLILDASAGDNADPVGVGAWVLFTKSTSDGQQLWRTDGTAAGTRQILASSAGIPLEPLSFEDRVVAGSHVYFAGRTRSLSRVWRSDGTDAGTRLVQEICTACSANPRFFVEWGGRAACALEASASAFREVWRTDGTAAGTRQVTFVDNSVGLGSFPDQFVTLRERAYFTVGGGPFGQELYTTDGTVAGTFLLEDLLTGTQSSSPGNLIAWNDALYFGATGDAGAGLYRSAGVPVGGGGSAPAAVRLTSVSLWSDFEPFDGKLWFGGGFASGSGLELWCTDGTVAGTTLAIDVVPGAASSFPGELEVAGGQLFFAASHPQFGDELWVTDGTSVGTRLLYDLWPGPLVGAPRDMHELNGGLLFTAQAGTNVRSLWWSDGTTSGTTRLAQFDRAPFGEDIDSIHIDGDRAWFRATDAVGGTELWTTDGTVAGTRRAVDLVPGPTGSFPRVFGRVGDQLLFRARLPNVGYELFATDGTAGGTVLVADIMPGPDDSYPDEGYIVGAGNRMLFAAYGPGGEGSEPWVTDGTTQGTRRLLDLYVGASGSVPSAWTRIGTKVVFRGHTAAHGAEPMVLDTDSIGAALADAYGAGCARAGAAVPRLVAARAPTLGAVDVLELVDVPPSVSAAIALGLRADRSIGFGCSLLVDPILAVLLLTTPVAGPTTVPLSIPNVSALLHLEVASQPAALDPAGRWNGSVNFGDGLLLRIGR